MYINIVNNAFQIPYYECLLNNKTIKNIHFSPMYELGIKHPLVIHIIINGKHGGNYFPHERELNMRPDTLNPKFWVDVKKICLYYYNV